MGDTSMTGIPILYMLIGTAAGFLPGMLLLSGKFGESPALLQSIPYGYILVFVAVLAGLFLTYYLLSKKRIKLRAEGYIVTPLIAGVILGTVLGYSIAPAVVAKVQPEVKYTEPIQSKISWEKWDFLFEINAKDVEDGKLIFEKECFYCHGKSGDGEGPLAHELYPKPADFTDLNKLPERSPDYLFTRISEGGWEEPYNSKMPRWMGILSEDEIWKVISYTYYLSTGITNHTEGGIAAEQVG